MWYHSDGRVAEADIIKPCDLRLILWTYERCLGYDVVPVQLR